MIKLIRPAFSHNKRNASYCALSTDEIPDYIKDVDEVYLIDSGIYTYYDASSGELVSEESNSGSDLFLINFNYSDSGYYINVEYEDVLDAVHSGKRVFAVVDIQMLGSTYTAFVPFTCVSESYIMFSCTSYDEYINVVITDSGSVFFGHDLIHNFYDVTLTPTSADYSGTMDKTPQEIDTAIMNDKTIRFHIPAMGAKVIASQYLFDNGANRWKAAANITYNPGTGWVMITVVTGEQSSTYWTNISPLTPMT